MERATLLDLPDVTLCCIDTRTPELAMRALHRSASRIRFGEVLLLTSETPSEQLPAHWRCELVRGVSSSADYSRFVLKELHVRIRTSHVLIVQWDGYVIDPDGWSEQFLQCDYIGALWPQFPDQYRIGNGGFSLRSKRLLTLMAGSEFEVIHPEDICIGRVYRQILEQKHGIVFANSDLAEDFAFERTKPRPGVFGFHGLSNFPLVERDGAALNGLLRDLPREVYRSVEARRLIKRLLETGRIELARWVLEQRCAEMKDDLSLAEHRLRWRVALARWRDRRTNKGKIMRAGLVSGLQWSIVSWLRELNRRRLNARRQRRSGLSRFKGPGGRWITAPTAWAWGLPDSDYLASLAERFRSAELASRNVDFTLASLSVGQEDGPTPALSIVIAAYGNLDLTLRCIKSIQDHAPSCAYEVIVIEDASGQPDALEVQGIKGVRFIRNEVNLGYLRSCNKAVQQARGRYVCLLNNDAEVTKGALDSLLELIERRDDAGAVGAKLVYPDGSLQEAGGVLWDNGWALNYGRFDDPEHYLYEYVREVDYVSGAALVVRKALWDRLGGYDEHYCPAYGEDSDLAIRIRQAGLKVLFQPRSVVIHHEGVSHGTSENSGLKAYQRVNRDKLSVRWASVLRREQLPSARGVFRARDRSAHAKVVLVIDHYVPEPDRDAGSKTMYQMLETLIAQNFTVKFWPDNLNYKPEYVRPLQDMGVEVIYGVHAPLFSSWIKACGVDIDYVLVSRPTVARDYVQLLRRYSSARLVYYGHDLHFARMALQAKVQATAISVKDVAQMKALERSVWRSVDMVLYPSAEEINTVLSLEPGINAQVICPYAFPAPSGSVHISGRENLLFVAGFQHPPNVDAAVWLVTEILPLLHHEYPNLHLTLAGSNPTPQVRALASDHVTVTGSVSDERLAELYATARVALIPLRFGAGIKLKVVEAMYKGVPLVTTSVGTQGLLAIGDVVRVADDEQTFASAVLELLSDDSAWLSTAGKQHAYAQQYFSPDAMARGLLSAFALTEEREAARA